jgi:spoIIIJ-associated protein
VEEAIEQGLQELGVSIGDVDVQVVEEGSKGLFGLFGSRLAKVRLTVKAAEEDPLGDLMLGGAAGKKPAEKAPAKAEKPAEKAPAKAEKPADKKPAEKKPEEKQPEEKQPEEKKSEEKKPAEKKPAEKKAATGKPVERKAPPKPAPAEEADAPAEPAAPRALEKPEVTMIPEDQLDPESPAGLALEFLKELTRLMGVDVTIDMGVDEEGNVYGFINGDTLGILIGRRGETLDALQYLTSLKVNRGKEGYTRVTLDTENYRAKREDTLIRLANRMANRALRTGRKVSLEPMNPYERRIIHYALQANEGVTTHSEGDEPNRHVVITLKK